MADAFEGTLNVRKTTTSQSNKTLSLNTADFKVAESTTGRSFVDVAGLSGIRTLSEFVSRHTYLNIGNAKAGALTVEIDSDIKKRCWIRNTTSDGAALSIGPTGGFSAQLPSFRWVLNRIRAATVEQMAGWQDSTLAPALVFGAAYQVTAAQALRIYKDGADPVDKAGQVTLEGSVEETTTVPAAGDTLVTLPVGYRPAHTIAFAVLAEPGSAANVDVVVVEITTAGLVILRSLLLWTAAINVPIDLSGISFFAAN